jgi:microsomal dipeptidase-like Zn-dependent dipeptidase
VSELDPAARGLLRRFPLIDGHNDLPWELRERGGLAAVNLAEPVDGTHTDLPRLEAGGVGAQFWSVFVPATLAEAVRRGLDPKDFAQLLRIKPEWEAAYPPPKATLPQVADHVEHVRRVAGVERAAARIRSR